MVNFLLNGANASVTEVAKMASFTAFGQFQILPPEITPLHIAAFGGHHSVVFCLANTDPNN